MRILFIAHRIPYPPNKGDKIRSFHEVRELGMRHELHLVCFIDRPDEIEGVGNLERYCATVHAVPLHPITARVKALWSLLTGRPFTVGYYHSREMHKTIEKLLGKHQFDAAIVFSSSMAQYLTSRSVPRKLMDFVDIDSDKWRQYADYHSFPWSWVYRLEATRLRRYEQAVAGRFDASIFVSEHEAATFQQGNPNTCSTVIPNGVDSEYFVYQGDTRDNTHSAWAPMLVFVGAMDYFANIDAVEYFVKSIFPKIQEAAPDAIFSIIGSNPGARVKRLEQCKGVTVIGTVPDVRTHVQRATVFVAPFRIARGIQNKVLEAMAMGIPVVASSLVASGIRATHGKELFIEDDPALFAMRVIQLLRQPALRVDIAQHARRLVEKDYRWSDQVLRLESLCTGHSH